MKEQSNVLIVASRTDLWCSMRDIVTNKKYRVAIAGDGTKAIDLMQKIHFDIVYLVGNTHANNKDAYNEIKQYAPGITVKQINQPHSN
ncbi:MAG: hypothetical protein HN929_02785 [Chloroflexi bacterium]|nr:hypothetical protein [Chloroflexota bacterium]MBT7080386.1 hypothetical protein [Chloroflexota bacterium]MBT7289444.1 hypothetical protein [Chloroflexota bacterium]